MKQLFGVGSAAAAPHAFGTKQWAALAVVAAFTFLAREKDWLWRPRYRVWLDSPVLQASLCYLAILFLMYSKTFIYFRF
jgi:hypothetical protein